jgi:hypothetical protein
MASITASGSKDAELISPPILNEASGAVQPVIALPIWTPSMTRHVAADRRSVGAGGLR